VALTAEADAAVFNTTQVAGISSIISEAREILRLALPLVMTNTAGYSLSCIADAMIGRLGSAGLSTSTLANSIYSMMGMSVVWGGAAGMETLAGQAYGAGDFRLLRLVLVRSFVVCGLIVIPIIAGWSHIEGALLALGQNPQISASSAVYLQALGPSLFAYVLCECTQTYLVSQNIVHPATWGKSITMLISPFIYYLLMFKCEMGLIGAAHAYTFAKLLNAVLLFGWIWHDHASGERAAREAEHLERLAQDAAGEAGEVEVSASGDGVQAGAVAAGADAVSTAGPSGRGWRDYMAEVLDPRGCLEYIKFGVPSALMTMLEWWAYEFNVLFAGTLPDATVAVAVLGIAISVSGFFFMFPASLGTAVCTRMSNALGAGNADLAKRNFSSALVLCTIQQALIVAVTLLFSTKLVMFYCDDPAVITASMAIMPIIAMNTIGGGFAALLNAVLRACGRQALGARLQLICAWVIGAPMAWYLGCNLGWGIRGFMLATGSTSLAQSLATAFIVSRFNWAEEVTRVQETLKDMGEGAQVQKSLTAHA